MRVGTLPVSEVLQGCSLQHPGNANLTNPINISFIQYWDSQDMQPDSEVTLILNDWANGDTSAIKRLLPLVYPDLHSLSSTLLHRGGVAEMARFRPLPS